MGLKKTQEKEFAKVLFTSGNLSQKEIAERVGTTEKTITKWIEAEGWRKLKRSLLNTKQTQLENFYDQLEWLNDQIATRPIIYDIPAKLLVPMKLRDVDGNERLEMPVYNPNDYPIKMGNVATSKEADVLLKITASINRLEVETSIGEIYEVAKQAIELAREESLPFAKQVTALFDTLIKMKSK
jgi:transcriptional regulator with XRE-family HTH domain